MTTTPSVPAVATSLAADIKKVLTDAGSDIEGATSGVMALVTPSATPPAAGSFMAAVDASGTALKAWGSWMGPHVLPFVIGGAVIAGVLNFAAVANFVTTKL
jgi:hypothetical protein